MSSLAGEIWSGPGIVMTVCRLGNVLLTDAWSLSGHSPGDSNRLGHFLGEISKHRRLVGSLVRRTQRGLEFQAGSLVISYDMLQTIVSQNHIYA